MDIQVGTIGRFKLDETSVDATIEGIVYKIFDKSCVIVCNRGQQQLVEKDGAKSIDVSPKIKAAYKAVLESILAVDNENTRHQQAMYSLTKGLSTAQESLFAATGTMPYRQFSRH